MILLCGIPSEPSLAMVVDAVRALGVPHLVFHQRAFASTRMEFQIDALGIHGWLQYSGHIYALEDFTAVYTRLMDYQLLPEVEKEPPQSPLRFHCAAVHDTLMRWYEIMPGLVLSRTAEVGVNYSKPYEAQLIRAQGFTVPDTLVTNDPDLVRDFRRQYGRVVYKSMSYIRSIVKILEDDDLKRLRSVRSCPTQFQQYVDGTNIRVHTIGAKAFATAITAKATDYRYAYLEGDEEHLEVAELSEDLTRRCIALSEALGLKFAGIDLKITPGGEVYCLEVNPCPAFSYYQRQTGQPIAEAVAHYLAGWTRSLTIG
jgi:RimK-like ATP-grasp domain